MINCLDVFCVGGSKNLQEVIEELAVKEKVNQLFDRNLSFFSGCMAVVVSEIGLLKNHLGYSLARKAVPARACCFSQYNKLTLLRNVLV